MTRFAWLQARTQTATAVAMLAVLSVAAAITGIQLSHLYSQLVAQCNTGIGCNLATGRFLSHDHFMDHTFDIVAQAAPALFGIFWGAPLVAREFETGTYQLAWTQSVTRARWLRTRLLIVGLLTAALAGVLTLTITWWYRNFHGLSSNQYAVLERRDIAPIGYAVFAVGLGVLAGALIRRTVPAMAATIGGYVFARVATTFWIRPNLLSPVHQTLSLSDSGPTTAVQLGIVATNGSNLELMAQGSGPANSWTLSSQVVSNGGGHVATHAQLAEFIHTYCPTVGFGPEPAPGGLNVPQPGGPGEDAARACLHQAAQAFHLVVTYQPANRYWTFQWLETGIFVALAGLCAATCYWWITRRAS